MLDRQSAKLLKTFIVLEKDAEDYVDTFFDSEELFEASGLSEKDVDRSVRFLVEEGYVRDAYNDRDQLYGFALTQRGRFYRTYRRIELMSFLAKSVLCPIVLSVLTTIIMNLLFSTPATS